MLSKVLSLSILLVAATLPFASQAKSTTKVSPKVSQTINIKYFANKEEIRQLRLSPDGTRLAAIVRTKLSDEITIFSLDSMNIMGTHQLNPKRFSTDYLEWVNNDRIIFNTVWSNTKRRELVPTQHQQFFTLNTHGKDLKKIKFKGSKKHDSFWFDNHGVSIVSLQPSKPNHILMKVSKNGKSGVYEVNIHNSKRQRVQKNKKDIYDWIADRQDRVKIGSGIIRNKITHIVADQKTAPLFAFEPFTEHDIFIAGFDENPKILYVSALRYKKYALYKIDINKPIEFTNNNLIYIDPRYDVLPNLIYDQGLRKVVGFSHQSDIKKIIHIDKTYQALIDHTKNRLKAGFQFDDLYITNFDSIGDKYTVKTVSKNSPGRYFIGSRKNNTLKYFADETKSLTDKNLYTVEKHHYTLRDGTPAEGRVYRPAKDAPQSNKTIIYMDKTQRPYDYTIDFLTNQGYTVFEPAYRGTHGYGSVFLQAGMGKWSESIYHDILDSLKALKLNKLIKTDNVCIMGTATNGYTALMATSNKDNIFKCSIAINPIADIEKFKAENHKSTIGRVLNKQYIKKNNLLTNVSKKMTPKRATTVILTEEQPNLNHLKNIDVFLKKID